MWFEGRWRASGWDLLGSRFQRRSLQRRRPRDTPLPPPWNLSFLLWWGHVLSVNWCVFFFYFCICKQQSSVTAGNDVCVEWLHNSRQKTRADWRNPVNFRESRRAAQKWSKWGKFSNRWVFFNTDTRLTVYCVMCRPIRVPHRRWVCCPAAEGSVLKKSGTAGPGWDLLQSCHLQVSLSWCHCNTPEAFEWESTESPQQKLLLQQSLQ